ncbi:unnamed protein product [Penicillium pancosmium]
MASMQSSTIEGPAQPKLNTQGLSPHYQNTPVIECQADQNTFRSYTGSPVETNTTVFFISGNPGLIGYYHSFLSLLVRYLTDADEPTRKKSYLYEIYGCSLGGFEVHDDEYSPSKSAYGSHNCDNQDDPKRNGRLYGLEDQICFVQEKLAALMDDDTGTSDQGLCTAQRRKVILIGHSAGAYIAMEIVRRHHEAGSNLNPSQPVRQAFDIVGGIMLFPTLLDIAVSPSGRKLTVR